MRQDYETSNFIGKGEDATFQILKHLTKLQHKSLKQFPYANGIYKQVPISWILSTKDFNILSESHKKGSIDLYLILNQKQVAIRVQGSGHGEGLKGIGKAQHDKVQKQLLAKYCEVVDILKIECRQVFLERVSNSAIEEIKSSFKTAGVLIPVC
jgi:hypothetical protein